MLMIVGIGSIAILTGAIAERFLAAQVEEAVEEARSIVLWIVAVTSTVALLFPAAVPPRRQRRAAA